MPLDTSKSSIKQRGAQGQGAGERQKSASHDQGLGKLKQCRLDQMTCCALDSVYTEPHVQPVQVDGFTCSFIQLWHPSIPSHTLISVVQVGLDDRLDMGFREHRVQCARNLVAEGSISLCKKWVFGTCLHAPGAWLGMHHPTNPDPAKATNTWVAEALHGGTAWMRGGTAWG